MQSAFLSLAKTPTPTPDATTDDPTGSGESSTDPSGATSTDPSGYPTDPSTDPVIPLTPELKEVVSDAPDYLRPVLSILIPVGAAALITVVAGYIMMRLLRKVPAVQTQAKRMLLPVFCLMLSLGLVIGTDGLISNDTGNQVVQAILKVTMIVCITWTVVTLISVFERSVLAQHVDDPADVTSKLAKMRTQVTLLKRVATAVVLVLGIGGVLLMIPAVQRLGTTILASAGLVSVVVGLAVQGVLANVFAGLQVAFTSSIRVDDVVFVEGQQGKVHEITLTYVVIAMADGRSMILPSTYFTTTPFENWSRESRELNGTVILDLTWDAPVDWIRHRVEQLVDASELWDGRSVDTSVSNAEGGLMRINIVLSARNAGDLWTLRNLVREKLITELKQKYPSSLPVPQIQRPPQA
ncbi:MAG: mechanosensitive ion channel family protein [Galactobacter sp.]|uniref:mechanosensitive ion channel family protein n=1 Tax=Galactobacter sp. TaxID=2676125 RepID=UPI0025C267C7|nr:mechanosensitive ion channel domain-containing protein [Galactobacter sp.]